MKSWNRPGAIQESDHQPGDHAAQIGRAGDGHGDDQHQPQPEAEDALDEVDGERLVAGQEVQVPLGHAEELRGALALDDDRQRAVGSPPAAGPSERRPDQPRRDVDGEGVEVEDFLRRVFVVAELLRPVRRASPNPGSPGLAYAFDPALRVRVCLVLAGVRLERVAPRPGDELKACRSRPCFRRPWWCGRCRRQTRTARHLCRSARARRSPSLSNFQIARCGLAAGDVAAVFPLAADRFALEIPAVGLRRFEKLQLAVNRARGPCSSRTGLPRTVRSPTTARRLTTESPARMTRRQADVAERPAEDDLEPLDRLGDDRVDRLVLDVGREWRRRRAGWRSAA